MSSLPPNGHNDGLSSVGTSTQPVVGPGEKLTPKALFSSLGSTGLGRFGGWVQDELLPELQGRRWRDTVREMMRDPTLGAALFAVEMLSRQVDWYTEPADETDQSKKYAEFAQSCLTDMSRSWGDTLAEILSMLPFGWAYTEIVYKIRKGPDQDDPKLRSQYTDNLVGWRKMELRPQETLDHWEFDQEGGTQGMWQMGPPDWQLHYIPIDKSLLFRTKARKNNPEGDALFYGAYRPWYFKRNIENIEGIGIERDLAGLPVMSVPSEILDPRAGPDQIAARQACEKIVRRVRRDEEEGILIPSDRDEHGNPVYELKLLSSGGARQFNINEVLQRKSMEMLQLFLADFMLVGHEKVGSFALSTSKINLFTTALGTFLDSIAEVITEFGFTRLFQLNRIDPKYKPQLKHGNIDPRDLVELGTFLQALAASGAPLFPNPTLLSYLMDQAGLPAPPELNPDEEEQVRQAQVNAQIGMPPPGMPQQTPPGASGAPGGDQGSPDDSGSGSDDGEG